MSSRKKSVAPATPAPLTFELAKRVKDHAVVDILDPAKQPTGIRIYLAGRYTDAARAARAIFASITKDDAPEVVAEKMTDAITALTIGWDGVHDEDGNPYPCEPHVVKALYEHPKLPFVFTQVSDAFTEHARFFEHAKTS